MRFDKIDAPAFGPLRDVLELAPGMNIIYGPNEAGKSSWHAALYAGLCGMRRAQGNSKDVREFAERHKPWDGTAWEVNVVITLADGRSVELRHDLVNRSSTVRDTHLAGRDYRNEILFEGAPDGSRWLGLNRRTFLNTACVRQADILGILDNPAMLQDDMQRAAATAGADSTAAAALQRLDRYLRDVVGTSRSPTKPLRQSQVAEQQARRALDDARAQREEYIRRRTAVDLLERRAQELQSEADAISAVIAEAAAAHARERLEEIRRLSNLFPDGPPHPSPGHDALFEQVTTALEAWSSRPQPIEPGGLTADALTRHIENAERELAALRAAVAEKEAEAAKERYMSARELSSQFPDGPPRTSPDEEHLANRVRDVLKDFESLARPQEPVGQNSAEIREELTAFDARTNAARSAPGGRRLPLLILSGVAIAAGLGIAFILPDLLILGAGLMAAGAAAGVVALVGMRPPAHDQFLFETNRRSIEQRLNVRMEEERRYQDDVLRRETVLTRLHETAAECGATASDDHTAVKTLHDWLQVREARLGEYGRLSLLWDKLQGLLAQQSLGVIEGEARRSAEVATRLVAGTDENLLAAARTRNLTREQLAGLEDRTSGQRIDWERQRAERNSADKLFLEDSRRVDIAHARLRAAVAAIGADADEPDATVAALNQWLLRRSQSVTEANERMQQWDVLQQMLGERSLQDVEDEVERLLQEAQSVAPRVASEALAYARAEQPTQSDLKSALGELHEAMSNHTEATGELTEFARTVSSVADAEDALANAERDHRRLAELSSTIQLTAKFLESAQERVHRDIAPILRETVLQWLPFVTDERYVDCRVNPKSLAVDLAGANKRWRNAALLSRGTAEQIYLLLRLALAQHLTREEPCPLILDDAVAACDAQRKKAILDTLLVISEDKDIQVILFTHEEDVRDWARARLTAPDHQLKELDRGLIRS